MLMRFMYKWFVYLDRFYVPRHQLDPLNSCAMKIFKELVYTSIHERAQKCLLRLVHKVRIAARWNTPIAVPS